MSECDNLFLFVLEELIAKNKKSTKSRKQFFANFSVYYVLL